ncbi:MAG: AraC family transcriptional regulator [Oscillospiraceae bacterium]
MLNKNEINSAFAAVAMYTNYHLFLNETYKFDGERHNFWEIVLVLDGSLGVTCDDKILELSKNQACLIRPNIFHKNWVIGHKNAEIVVLTFELLGSDIDNFGNRIYNCGETLDIIKNILTECERWIYEKGTYGFCEKKNSDKNSPQMVKNLLEIVLASFFRQEDHKIKPPKNAGTKIFNLAVTFMKENTKETLTLLNISKHCHISDSTLKKVFKKYTGLGVMHYFTDMKIQATKIYLIEGYAISEIADIFNFSSQNYYAMVFKKLTGLSPRDFKKEYEAS